MKRVFSFLLLISCSFNVGAAERDTTTLVRKFPVATLLMGLANTLASIGNVIGASSNSEKQQAALGIVGSLFSMAGSIVAQQEQDKIDKDHKEREKEAQQQQEEHKRHFCELVVDLIDAVQADDSYHKRGPKLATLKVIEQEPEREKRIEQLAILISSPQSLREVLDDTMLLVKQVISCESKKLKNYRSFGEEGVAEGEVDIAVDKQIEKLDQDIVTFAKAVWFFVVELIKKEDVLMYLKDQLFILADYIKEKFVFFLGQEPAFQGEEQ